MTFDLGINYESFYHDTIDGLARDLIVHCEHTDQLWLLLYEVVRQRPDGDMADLLGRLSRTPDKKKVQIIVVGDSLELSDENANELAALLGIPRDQIVIVGMARGTIRILASLPMESSDRWALAVGKTFGEGRYRVRSIVPFDQLDRASKEAWRFVACSCPPRRSSFAISPAIAWWVARWLPPFLIRLVQKVLKFDPGALFAALWRAAVPVLTTLTLVVCGLGAAAIIDRWPLTPKTVAVQEGATRIIVIERQVTRIVNGEARIEIIVETQVVDVEPVVITATPVPSEKPVTLNVNLGTEPSQVDPALSTDAASVQVDEVLFLGLTDLDDVTGEVIPELATEWSVSEDGLVWTFKMREDVPWVRYDPATGEAAIMTDDEGNPAMVNAHDVEYAVKRTLDPATGSDDAYVLYIIEGAMAVNTGEKEDLDTVGVKAVGDYTVEFTLRQPAGYFPGIASMWVARPVYAPVIKEYGARWIEPGIIVSNGPYLMEEWTHFDSMAFVKNPEFYDADSVQIERVEAVIIDEASTSFAMYENNELDTGGVPLEEMDRVKADPVLSEELLIDPILCTYYYGFTNNKPPFDDVLVRKAFSAAIDRVSLVENVTKGGQIPANTFAPAGIFGNVAQDPDIAPWALDPELGKEMARQWLAEAGYPDGEGFPAVTLMHNTSEGHHAIAEAIQAMWRDTLGVEVQVVNQEWGVYLETIDKGTPLADMPHIWRMGWCADYADQNNWVYEVFNNEKGANRLRRGCLDDACTEVKEGAFDALTKAAGAEQDPARRLEMYRQAEKMLSEEEAAYAPIYYYSTVTLTKPWLTRTYQKLAGQHWDKWTIDWAAKQAATE